jgi:predicted phosphodiesterase
MAPERKPVPEDFQQVRDMFRNEDGSDNLGAVAKHYSQGGVVVDPRMVRKWIDRLGEPTHSTPSKRTVNEIIRDAGDDPKMVEVTKTIAMRYIVPSGEQTYIKAEWKPSIGALAARPEGWKRPKIAKRKTGGSDLVAICGDQHAPEHDRVFHAKYLSWLADNQPSKIIVLGDLLENADVSRWADRDGQATAKESIDAAYFILRDYIEAAPNAEIVWIEGNHDQRVEAYANVGSPKLAKVARAGETEPVLSIPHLMRLDELNVEYVTGYPLSKVKLTDKLAVIHGKAVRRGAGATALANLEKRGYSVVSGHTHRAGVVFKTVMDIDDTPSTIMGAETGTMKHIKPEVFDEAPDHQNAFVTAVIHPDEQFHLEPAIYSAGFLRWRDQRY